MKQGGEAVCLVSVDTKASPEVIDAIKSLDHVKIVDSVSL